MVCPILISVAVTPGVSFDVPAPPRMPRPSGMASAAAARVPSQDLVFDMGASLFTGNLLRLDREAQTQLQTSGQRKKRISSDRGNSSPGGTKCTRWRPPGQVRGSFSIQ